MEMDDDACYRAIQTRDRRFDGRLFVAVTTTGVYCRPFCPAPTPRRENARFFPTAAAAQEAGFRPCLRCRPEVSPDLAVWRGTANTVSRAVELIEEGALDGADVEVLAERLGVGGRHLRRLFRQHLGASPVSIAQTRRVLLAKQLIQDTRLPMAEVAAAAGFGSVRRFNETFRRMYRRPPEALRRASAAAAAAPEAGAVRVRLGYRPPYAWDHMVSALRARAIPGVEAVAGGRYARAVAIDGERGVLLVEPAAGHCLEATVRLSGLRVLPAVVARVRRVFDLAADPVAIDAHLGLDPLLAPLVAARPGVRIAGAWDGFEAAVRAIVGQQDGAEAAAPLLCRLASCLGEEIGGPAAAGLGLARAFPTAQRLAGADLAAIGVPEGARTALSALASAVAADPLIFGPYRSFEDAVARLRSLPGMDERIARRVAMRGSREPDAFGEADVGRMRAACSGPWPPAELRARAEDWRPWRAYAALHLRLRAAAADSPLPSETVPDGREAA